MTPAINLAKQQKLDYQVHEYSHDNKATSYGLEAVEKLGVDADRLFKTLVVCDDNNKLAVAILPVNHTLNLKKMAKAIATKKVSMANPKVVERITGYVLGGVSPLGQKKRLFTIIDSSAQNQVTVFVSAGKRGLEIELPPHQLAAVLRAQFSDIVNN